MEPRIQYLRTPDGVSIAYTIMGEGTALIMGPSPPFCHLEAEWWVPSYRLFHERLAEKTTLVRYDPRGCGLSDRDVGVITLEDRILDLEAVIDHLHLDRVAMMGYSVTGPVTISYAARHPDRVSHLTLWDAFARASDYSRIPQLSGLLSLLNSDWETFTETVASVFFGWSAGEPAREFAKYVRECVTAEEARAIIYGPSWTDFDVTAILGKVEAPTLVVRNRDAAFPGVEIARSIASAIPNASLAAVDGVWITSAEISESGASLVLRFLGVDVELPGPAPSAFRTVLFTDLVGHTEMMSRLGDERGREVLRKHERITREVLAEHSGTEVKTTGDGFMASFGSVTKAVECAVALQRAFADREGEPLSVRVGLNAGEPIEEDGDLFGATVILASRIAAKAQGGEILVADTVRGLCSGKGFLFTDRGEFLAKGFEEPVRVYEVAWREGT